jgi:4-hydroxy-tetrahydrodipicolinate synthase
MISLSSKQLKGSFPPIVTPFLENGAVDYETYAKLVDFQAAGGSHGVVVTGTTGEPSTLSPDERTELLKVAIAAAKGRIQVVAATGAQNHADTVTMTLAAEKAGADALLIVTPYFIRPPQRGLEAYYIDLCKRTSLPVMIYHIPGRAAVNMTADTIARIAGAAPNLAGIKHAVNDLALVSELIVKLGTEFRIHVGLEELSFPMVCLGAHGLMNAVGNLAPGKVAELYEATAKGDLDRGRALHYELYELNTAVFFDTNPIPMKYMMMRMGLLPNETHRLPMVPSTPELRARLDGVLTRAGLVK